jgi:hypothetical protein
MGIFRSEDLRVRAVETVRGGAQRYDFRSV